MDSYKISGMKMDFENLISCIKCHDDSTSVILEALKTIVDMCRNETCGRDALREVGGLNFLLDFLSTTDKTIVLEYSLKVIAFAVDGNVLNQMFMTKSNVFQILLTILMKKLPISVLNNTGLLISTILFNNSKAQVLLHETGLIQELIDMYKCYDPILKMDDRTILYPGESRVKIWLTINTALCFAVNNPLNENNQQICSSLLPLSLKILENSDEVEIIVGASTFLSLSIANNERNQDAFAKYDGAFVIKYCLQKMFDSLDSDLNVFSERTLLTINSISEVISATSIGHGDNRTYVLDEECFDKLLGKNLLICNDELHIATKCLLQVCVSNKDENCKTDGQPLNLNVSNSNERKKLSCWLKLDKRHNQEERKHMSHEVLGRVKQDNHRSFAPDCKSKMGTSSLAKFLSCHSSNVSYACKANEMHSRCHDHECGKCKSCTCSACNVAIYSSCSSNHTRNLFDYTKNLNSLSVKNSTNSNENITHEDLDLTDESSLESAGDLNRKIKYKTHYCGTANGNSNKTKCPFVAQISNLSSSNILHLDCQQKCSSANDCEPSSSFSNKHHKLMHIHHNQLNQSKSNIFLNRNNSKSVCSHSGSCKSLLAFHCCNKIKPFTAAAPYANLKLGEEKGNQTSTPILDIGRKGDISQNSVNFSSLDTNFSNFKRDLPYRESNNAAACVIPESEITLHTTLEQVIDSKINECSNVSHSGSFRRLESLHSPRYKQLTEVVDNDFKRTFNDSKQTYKKNNCFQHPYNRNLNSHRFCDSSSVKSRRNDYKDQKTLSGESDTGKSINSSGCIEVIVFPGTSCVAHKLASNSEMLRVAPLDDIISNNVEQK